jgi:hypothetical protein
METLLSSVLSSLIGQYVQNLDADAVTDSLWAKGALKLRSLQLNTEVLALDTEAGSAPVFCSQRSLDPQALSTLLATEAGVPLGVRTATIKELTIEVISTENSQ